MAVGSNPNWLEVFGPAFEADSSLAENAARLWHELLGQIEAGPSGLRDARECLQSAIRGSFPYTEAFKRSREQFEEGL